jgi:hypothetical protein
MEMLRNREREIERRQSKGSTGGRGKGNGWTKKEKMSRGE